MKYQILIIICLFTTPTLYSQNNFTSLENRDSILLKNIEDFAMSVYDKRIKIDKLKWYKGDSTRAISKNLKRFKKDLYKSKQTLDYYIDRHTSKTGYIQFSVNFFKINNYEQHSKIYVGYKPGESMADFIQIDNKEEINQMKAEWKSQVSDIPPPPLPMMKKN
ncbi:hypothetical protein N1F78_05885 [Seonamhaeicola sp. MEBiC1930]|uniref:hypothetical protein n=1 Tax=Seonamhaeicola sp. MEBiC01930 TaxID=2976768 RepID=UPI00324C560B